MELPSEFFSQIFSPQIQVYCLVWTYYLLGQSQHISMLVLRKSEKKKQFNSVSQKPYQCKDGVMHRSRLLFYVCDLGKCTYLLVLE